MNFFGKTANAVCFWGGAALGAIFRADYLAKARRGARVSEKALKKILRVSRDTEFGKRFAFSAIKSVGDYQRAVPLTTYDDYQDYISRMVNGGEQNLITGRRISYYATTSGSVGQTKLIPQAFSCYGSIFKVICLMVRDAAAAMQRRGACGVPARGLLTTEIHIGRVDDGGEDRHTSGGGVSSYAINGVKVFLPLFTPFPKEAFEGGIENLRYVKARCALMDPNVRWLCGPYMSMLTDIISYILENHEMLIRDIESGRIDPSIRMSAEVRGRLERKLRPDPMRAAELRAIFDGGSEKGVVSKIWKKLSLVQAVGAGDFMPFTKKMLHWCDTDVSLSYASYTASEAWMGYSFHFSDPRYLLLLDGNFYEFLPVDENGETDTAHPLLMQQLEVGKYYEIVLTTPAGLYRYRLRDVLKVTGFEGETPYFEFAYRANRTTDLCGSHITDAFVNAAVEAVEKELGLRIDDYSLYADTEHLPPRVVMFMEPERPVDAEERRRMREVFEAALVRVARGYRISRQANNLGVSEVYPVEKGSYMRYRQLRIAKGAAENQMKSIRVIKPGEELAYFLAAVTEVGKQRGDEE